MAYTTPLAMAPLFLAAIMEIISQFNCDRIQRVALMGESLITWHMNRTSSNWSKAIVDYNEKPACLLHDGCQSLPKLAKRIGQMEMDEHNHPPAYPPTPLHTPHTHTLTHTHTHKHNLVSSSTWWNYCDWIEFAIRWVHLLCFIAFRYILTRNELAVHFN